MEQRSRSTPARVRELRKAVDAHRGHATATPVAAHRSPRWIWEAVLAELEANAELFKLKASTLHLMQSRPRRWPSCNRSFRTTTHMWAGSSAESAMTCWFRRARSSTRAGCMLFDRRDLSIGFASGKTRHCGGIFASVDGGRVQLDHAGQRARGPCG
jgi:hypothetical protein